jgi:hypothetical protein
MSSEFLSKVLPWIGAAATSNVPALITLAASEVGKLLGVEVTAEPTSITTAVASATPEQLAAMKQLDLEFAAKMQAMGFKQEVDILALNLGGVANARERETATKDSITPRLLATFAVTCFVGLVYAVLSGIAPADGMKDTFLILVGAAIAVFKDVYGYYFGSSAGSAAKDKVIAKM